MPLRKKKRKISMWGEVVLAAEDERDFSQFSQCPNIKKKKKNTVVPAYLHFIPIITTM